MTDHKRHRPIHQRAGGRLRSWYNQDPRREPIRSELRARQGEIDWDKGRREDLWQDMEDYDRGYNDDPQCDYGVGSDTLMDLVDENVLVLG